MIIYRELGFHAVHSHHGMMQEPTHPHDFRIVIGIRGAVNEEGFICDYRAIKRLTRRVVIRELEGSDLDTLFDYATCENLSVWIWKRLDVFFPLHSIEVYEKPHSRAIYYGPEKDDPGDAV